MRTLDEIKSDIDAFEKLIKEKITEEKIKINAAMVKIMQVGDEEKQLQEKIKNFMDIERCIRNKC